MFRRILEQILGLPAMDAIYARSERDPAPASIFQRFTTRLDLHGEIDLAGLARIPRTGPVIVVANHPTGAMEGILLPAILDGIRDDVKILGHSWFRRWPQVAERMILVDPQAGETSRSANERALREAASWVRGGGMLLLFPAGEVARFDPRTRRLADPKWRRGLAHLVRLTRARVLPVHVSGRNSVLFYLLSILHARLGALLLGRELLWKRGRILEIRIGEPLATGAAGSRAGTRDQLAAFRRAVERLA